ncbi:hypothetical protein FUA23_07605 [Neolewinella aurantiaca]|uniref:Serpin domain-containing protein n=1 Tax=Neolewinella aurantiaca TaxID=2602767 RepID=A0A5C7FUU3_9BACT|nr:hypothetical protein [Neolewinella aurantiaca]TXF90097.1 hypothetical protein FUA23_07605 [Neolewinella aurantiaca]
MIISSLPLTGAVFNGNYLWSVAMNLAWNELVEHQLGGSATIKTEDPALRQLVDRLNTAVFNQDLLDPAAYFVRSGIGQKDVLKAREDLLRERDVRQSLLNDLTLQPLDIFSYARFGKKLSWKSSFSPYSGRFMGESVGAFRAKDVTAPGLDLLDYDPSNPEKTVLRLHSDNGQDEVYLLGGYTPGREAEMTERVRRSEWPNAQRLNRIDAVCVPNISFNVHREYSSMVGQQLINPLYPDAIIARMESDTSFTMNHEGARVEDEAVITLSRSAAPRIRKDIRFETPFMVVVKQQNNDLPYLVLGITNTRFLEPEEG